MKSLIQRLWQQLTPKTRQQIIRLQFLVIIMAFFEVLSLAAIAPFMALIADPSLLESHPVLAHLYQASGLNQPRHFMLLAGAGVLASLLLGAAIASYTVWRLSYFAAGLGHWISALLYRYYLRQPWLYHTQTSSSRLSKQLATEANRVTQDILHPLVQMTGRGVLSIFIIIALLIYNPLITLVGAMVFASAYLLLFYRVKRTLHKNGAIISAGSQTRYQLMQEGFGGIKDLILLQRQNNLIKAFSHQGQRMAHAQGSSMALIMIPRYIIELITFGGLIALILLLVLYQDTRLTSLLPLLSVYALAGFKLLPSLQFIYNQTAHIQANLAALEAILPDLEAAAIYSASAASAIAPCIDDDLEKLNIEKVNVDKTNLDKIDLETSLKLENVSLTYPNKSTPALNQISLTINAHQTVGIAGTSGAGKSTLVDLLLGLIPLDSGKITLNGQPLTAANIPRWQASLGYVPQQIFLTDSSIAANIALALPPEQFDLQRIQKALQQAQLWDWVSSLPEGLNTPVGEQGIQLSGGQRQRIGIARALYRNVSTLVFDEATSALDNRTEAALMDAIYQLAGSKTLIIISHRLETLSRCDTLLVLEQGKLVEQGAGGQ